MRIYLKLSNVFQTVIIRKRKRNSMIALILKQICLVSIYLSNVNITASMILRNHWLGFIYH